MARRQVFLIFFQKFNITIFKCMFHVSMKLLCYAMNSEPNDGFPILCRRYSLNVMWNFVVVLFQNGIGIDSELDKRHWSTDCNTHGPNQCQWLEREGELIKLNKNFKLSLQLNHIPSHRKEWFQDIRWIRAINQCQYGDHQKDHKAYRGEDDIHRIPGLEVVVGDPRDVEQVEEQADQATSTRTDWQEIWVPNGHIIAARGIQGMEDTGQDYQNLERGIL